MTPTLLDTRGMRCPWPTLRLARLLREGEVAVEILADDPAAPRELAALADARQLSFETVEPSRFRIGC